MSDAPRKRFRSARFTLDPPQPPRKHTGHTGTFMLPSALLTFLWLMLGLMWTVCVCVCVRSARADLFIVCQFSAPSLRVKRAGLVPTVPAAKTCCSAFARAENSPNGCVCVSPSGKVQQSHFRINRIKMLKQHIRSRHSPSQFQLYFDYFNLSEFCFYLLGRNIKF